MCYRGLPITNRITCFPARLVSWSSENIPARLKCSLTFSSKQGAFGAQGLTLAGRAHEAAPSRPQPHLGLWLTQGLFLYVVR